mgnify:CR=1 FL=1
MSDPTRYFSSVVLNPDDTVAVGPDAHSSSFVGVDIDKLRQQLMSYKDMQTKRTNLDKLIAALAVCADHGLDLINDKQVALDKEPPSEDALRAIADKAGTTPGVVADVWKLLVTWSG